jgi:branched-chain amino acid transport system permease protein
VVWGFWSLSSGLAAAVLPPDYQARAAALQLVVIGVLIAVILVLRPRGLLAEPLTVSRFVAAQERRKSGAG